MNKLPRKILCELDHNSRNKLSNIAKKCRTSQQMVSYTVKQLIKKGKITDFTTVFDYSRFGLNSYIVLFKLLYRKKQKFEKFIKKLKDTNELIHLEVLKGKFDVYAIFLAPNPSYFNKILKKIKTDNKKVIRSDTIITTIVSYLFRRAYLNNKKSLSRKYSIVGGDRKVFDLKKNQEKICRELFEDPRKSIKDICRNTDLSFRTITKAIKELKNKRVIKGFKPVISFDDEDFFCKKILINYQNFTGETEDKIVEFCKKSNNVINLTKTFGEWDLILTVEGLEEKTFDEFLLSLRENYGDMIFDFEILNVLNTRKNKYLPDDHFRM